MTACESTTAKNKDLPLVAFLLQPGKVHRVVTRNLQSCAAARGLRVCSTTLQRLQEWQGPPPAILVHKLPCTAELEAALSGFLASHPSTILIDPPVLVRALDDRVSMLRPLAGSGLLLQNPESTSTPATVQVSCPQQVTLEAPHSHQAIGTSAAVHAVHAAGLQYPLLVKLRFSTAAAAAGASPAATVDSSSSIDLPGGTGCPSSTDPEAAAAAAAAAAHKATDGHVIGLVNSDEGVGWLASGQHPVLRPPLVLQQYVAHGSHLYKVYVVGDHTVLATRNTLTQHQLQEALATPEATVSGVCVLPRLSAVPKSAAAHTAAPPSNNGSSGAAVGAQAEQQQAEASAPLPLWAVQQLAAYMRQQLQLNLFNMDIIAPSTAAAAAAAAATAEHPPRSAGDAAAAAHVHMGAAAGAALADGTQQQQQQQGCGSGNGQGIALQLLVVDVNYFPGLDKVPGSEAMLADYLARVVAAGNSNV